MLKLKSKLLASILCLGLTPSLALAAPIEFNYQSAYMGPHVFNLDIGQPWAKNLEKNSKNELIAHYFMDGGLVKSNDLPHSIQAGSVDMGTTGLNFCPDITTLAFTAGMGFVADNAIHSTKLINKLYNDNKDVQDEQAKIGKFLSVWGTDRSAFFSTVGPIKSPADLKGKRVLVWGGKDIPTVKEWGGIPVQVIPSDTYLGLQRGMGDVFLGPIPVGVSYKIMEVAKDITPINAINSFIFTWVSWDLWNDMSSTQQNALVESTKNWSTDLAKKLVEVSDKDLVTMSKAGCKITTLTESEIKQFADVSKKITYETVASEFKRYNVKKDAKQWVDYVFKVADEVR